MGPSYVLRPRSLPCPYVHANLPTAGNRQPSMQRPWITRPIRQQVLPEDCVSFDRPECDALLPLLVTVDVSVLTPTLISGGVHGGEVGAPARSPIRDAHVGKERRGTVAAKVGVGVGCHVGVPVCVEMEVLADSVPDQLNWLEMGAWDIESLELKRAVFYTPDYCVAGHVR